MPARFSMGFKGERFVQVGFGVFILCIFAIVYVQ